MRAFPTWAFPGGRVVEGEMTLDELEAELDAAEALAAAAGAAGAGGAGGAGGGGGGAQAVAQQAAG